MIINSPSQVLGTRPRPITPPSVMMWIRVEIPEAVYKPRFRKLIHSISFFGQKPRALFIRDRIMNINRFVANVIITTQDQFGMFLSPILDIPRNIIKKFVFEVLTNITRGA